MVYFFMLVVKYVVFVCFLELLCTIFLLQLPMAVDPSRNGIGPMRKKSALIRLLDMIV